MKFWPGQGINYTFFLPLISNCDRVMGLVSDITTQHGEHFQFHEDTTITYGPDKAQITHFLPPSVTLT